MFSLTSPVKCAVSPGIGRTAGRTSSDVHTRADPDASFAAMLMLLSKLLVQTYVTTAEKSNFSPAPPCAVSARASEAARLPSRRAAQSFDV